MSMGRKLLVKVIILGDASVGKTSLLQRYVKKQFSESYKTTIGADFLSKELITAGGKALTLQLWDTAGQERFQGLGNAFFRGSDACLLCYDITNDKSFEALSSWKEAFISQSGCTDTTSFPFVVVGNKLDQEAKRTVPKKKAQLWCEENGFTAYYEASAKEDKNVTVVFDELANIVVAKLNEGIQDLKDSLAKEEQSNTVTISGEAPQPQEKSGCC